MAGKEMNTSIDREEVARFDRLAETWWDVDGPMRPLHQFNPVRVEYLARLLSGRLGSTSPAGESDLPLAGLRILDIGCGGGVLAEALARLGASVTGIDPAPTNIAVAQQHAGHSKLAITYLCTTAEALVAQAESYDAVLAMEVVEHVRDVKAFVATSARLVRPGGVLVMATLNRTLKSYAFAIVGAEYVLRWLPKGTHRWEQFVTPRELARAMTTAGLRMIDKTGVVYHPLTGTWRQSRDMDVNYIMAAERKA